MSSNVHAAQEKNSKCAKKRYSWAYSWTWRHHNVALFFFFSVAAALPKAGTLALMIRWMFAWEL